eukprot:scaffold187054_cov27-Tisochrysis_lutea.AAC.3
MRSKEGRRLNTCAAHNKVGSATIISAAAWAGTEAAKREEGVRLSPHHAANKTILTELTEFERTWGSHASSASDPPARMAQM